MTIRNTKIAIFYHVFQHGDWQNLVREQFDSLVESGLASAASFIHVGVNGSEPITGAPEKSCIVHNPQPWLEETPTLESLLSFCLLNPGWRVLYLHTKGVTHSSPAVSDWRHIMEHFCIEQWRDAVQQLDKHDAVGCLYMDECYFGFFPHFSGNFWWANSEYITRLDHSYLKGEIRQNREFWIGTGKGSLFSFHTTGLNHYAVEYPRHLYAMTADSNHD